jgi:pimeloyl-ACP methyl ester carboxylesterase
MRDIVLLHGGSHGSWCWRDFLPALERAGHTGRVLLLDMPGCGAKRALQNDTRTLAEIAEGLSNEVAAAKLHAPLLIGHSIAGILLPHMAPVADHLCYLTASMPSRNQSIMQMMGSTLRGVDPTVVGWPVEGEMPDRFRAMFGPDIAPETFDWMLSEIAQDMHPACLNGEAITLQSTPGTVASYIVTQRDPILPPCWQGRFAERVGARDLYEIDTPHEPFISHPDLLATLIVERLI